MLAANMTANCERVEELRPGEPYLSSCFGPGVWRDRAEACHSGGEAYGGGINGGKWRNDFGRGPDDRIIACQLTDRQNNGH